MTLLEAEGYRELVQRAAEAARKRSSELSGE
jgi:pyrroline-5-carboxylate reductase